MDILFSKIKQNWFQIRIILVFNQPKKILRAQSVKFEVTVGSKNTVELKIQPYKDKRSYMEDLRRVLEEDYNLSDLSENNLEMYAMGLDLMLKNLAKI